MADRFPAWLQLAAGSLVTLAVLAFGIAADLGRWFV